MFRYLICAASLLLFCQQRYVHAQDSTYAMRLGFPDTARVLILHMDDAGMSFDSDSGIIRVLQQGAARSTSVMMPCPWVPHMVRYIIQHHVDAGLHLTLTSEWKDYRWMPVAGAAAVPGLVDSTGHFWPDVADVVKHASPQEVSREIEAQLAMAERMGFYPTHLDSHMGTLFATPAFLQAYVQLGISHHIPIMLPGGHDSYLNKQMRLSPEQLQQLQALGKMLWQAGLPVLDDLHNTSYDWKIPTNMPRDDDHLRKWRVALYEKTLLELKPGLTMVIMHCTDASCIFQKISDSGDIRKADMLAMLDPGFQAFLRQHGFIITTWREVMQRRAAIQQ
ncbi:MAG: polysaccharide deacetylase family protein [Thermoflavifilum sp.]|nr:polysaccharide deacetylase family protein [Thermoflavifilum sp.]